MAPSYSSTAAKFNPDPTPDDEPPRAPEFTTALARAVRPSKQSDPM